MASHSVCKFVVFLSKEYLAFQYVQDLRGCLEGRTGIDWEEVKQMAVYEHTSLPKNHRLVGEFWDYVKGLGLEDGRTLLFFM